MIHQNRRKKLLSQFAANSLLIISTNSQQQRSGDVNYPFRPDSDFWYLTGFTEPEAVAVFSDKTQIIFLRDKDSKSEIWDGEMLGVAAAAAYLGIGGGFDGFYARLISLREELHVPEKLRALGVGEDRLGELAVLAAADPSAAGNPVELSVAAAESLFRECI
ncbi:MAG: hypothetical protein HAW59_02490 [Betaproteobacteria bacterium]|nr:hypothetical protein [Betaproteobacteria bacterium]